MLDPDVEYGEIFNDKEQLTIQNEFKRLKGLCYLDHTGCPAYSDSQLFSIFDDLRNNVFGNPHSGSTTSKYCVDSVDQIRYKILQHFNTTANEYSVIFTSGATAALKLVAESFLWSNKYDNQIDISSEKSVFIYMEDNHTSVLGMRNTISQKNVETICLSYQDTVSAFNNSSSVDSSTCASNSLFVYSAQCNFSGVKYPLSWINEVQQGVLTAVTGKKSNWYCLLDAATYTSTNRLNLSSVKPDFVAISFYKMFGFPTGLGALLVRNSVSHLLEKSYYGGGTVLVAMSEKNIFVPRPVLHERFEDGTINFLSIISLDHGFKIYEKIVDLDKISKHCFDLARYAFRCLLRLHHANGNPLAIIYADTDYSDVLTQGNILNFNLLRPNGEYIGYAEVMNLANLHGIQLRTGCFCNPGACRRHLNITSEEVMKHFEAGHVCGDNNDLIDGKPTGSVRVSFGLYTTIDDVKKFLEFIETCFVMKPTIKKYPINWQQNPGLVAENNKYIRDSLTSKSSLRNKLAAINLIYFWLENVDESDNYRCPVVNSIEQKAKKDDDHKILKKPRLSHLFLYPIKSCGRFSVSQWELCSTGLRYDREWMITTAAGVVLTQKSHPRLCMIRPSIDLKEKKLILSFKGYPNFSISIEDQEKEVTEVWLCSSKVCGDSVRGLDCGDSVSLWLSHVLGKEGLRLIRQRERYTKSGDALSFSNQAQYLLINKASVDWLSEKLEEMPSCKRDNMLDRFRSNFVVEGLPTPFEEQSWTEVKLGNHDFKVSGPCMRCQMICIDQDSGEKTKEPLTTLAASMKGKLKFDKRRRDGRAFNEGNIQYAYRFARRNPASTSARSRQIEATREEKRQAERTRRRRQEEGQREEQEGPSTSTQRDSRTAYEILTEGDNEDDEDMNMDIGEQGHRERRDAPMGSGTGGSGSSASGGNRNVAYVMAGRNDKSTFSLEHTHLFNTWGNAYKVFSSGEVDKDDIKIMMTSLSCVPVQSLCFWMSYAEYTNIPLGTRVESVECIVIPKGFKTSFDTGVSITSSANNTQGVFAQAAVGLNKHFQVRNYSVKRNSVQPMILDSIEFPKTHDMPERMWGYHKFDDTGSFAKSVPTCIGVARSIPYYMGLLMPYRHSQDANKLVTGWPDMMKFSKTFNFLDHIEIPVVHYRYKIKTSVLFPKESIIPNDFTRIDAKCCMGGEDIRVTTGSIDKEGKGLEIKRPAKLTPVPFYARNYDTYLSEVLENCSTMSILDHTPPNSGHPQPSLHIGVMPIQTNAPEKEMQEYVSCCATWEIKTKITMSTDHHEHYTWRNVYAPNKIPWGLSNRSTTSVFSNSVVGFNPV